VPMLTNYFYLTERFILLNKNSPEDALSAKEIWLLKQPRSGARVRLAGLFGVADFNPEAKRFYEKNGYRQVGEIPGLYREGITEYIMMKEK